ncbi:hypothetical protein [Syntrophus aciditrophicus]|nr:hypothetical protein [Syntrophus aciditrophicus]
MEKDHLEVILESIEGKFDLVLEGHEVLRKEIRDVRQELCEKITFVDFKVEALNKKVDSVRDELNQKIDGVEARLSKKIDAVAADLAAHRADTEAHPPVYRIKENK